MTLQEALQAAKSSSIVGARSPFARPVRAVIPAPKDVELFEKFKEYVASYLQKVDFEELNGEAICKKFGETNYKIVGVKEGLGNEVIFDEIVQIKGSLSRNKR